VNIQEYISSGIVESYVLGLASEEERKEFEQYCDQYPELLNARTAFELSLEQQAMANAIVPAPAVKSKLMEAIGQTATVVTMNPAPVRKMNGWKIAAAACIALLAGSVYLNYTLSVNNTKLSKERYQAEHNFKELVVKIGELQNNPSIKMAGLKGESIAPTAYGAGCIYYSLLGYHFS
jgi:anti-sigma-K factor RskA